MDIKITEAFELAYKFITETNLNIFLTGKAGTGKTTFLKYLRSNSHKKMVVAAPTGVAAINAGGVTLHSLFQLPFAPFVPGNTRGQPHSNAIGSHALLSQLRYNREKLQLLRTLELLVIDEASMVASHTVDAIDAILRSMRRKHDLPFGGVQVLFIGDLHQLPPVIRNQEWEFLKNYYASAFFFDSHVLQQNIPVMVELKEIFRQKDGAFISVLNEVRHNALSEEGLTLLNSRLNRNFMPAEGDGYITLTTHNAQADDINRVKLKALHGRSYSYKAVVNDNFPENAFPADPFLELKEGAQVMFLKNDVEAKKYFNGKIGTVTELGEEEIKVQCKGESNTIDVKKHEWKNMSYSLNPDTREITEKELGSFRQYPLRLAWAITIHKSQGLTFDKLVIDSEKAFATGQVYVALSRCTSLEGLVLTSPVNRRFLGADLHLRSWQEKNHDEKSLPMRFRESREAFALQELQEIFAWGKWKDGMNALEEVITEYKDDLPAAVPKWFDGLKERIKTIEAESRKFREDFFRLFVQHSVMEENQPLQQKIKEAAAYFSEQIGQWKPVFSAHPLSTDLRQSARKLDEAMDEISIALHEALRRTTFCKQGFILNDYLRSGKKISSRPEKISGTYANNRPAGISPAEVPHNELYHRLADMRSRIAEEEGLPLYTVFSNNTIKNVCSLLPGTPEALLQVKGFGKAKSRKLGAEVLEIVRGYCNEKGLSPAAVLANKRIPEKLSFTVEESLRLFLSGKTVEEVSTARGFAVSTIEGHLADALRLRQVSIEQVMQREEAEKILALLGETSSGRTLTEIKQLLPADISWGKLRMAIAWKNSRAGDSQKA